MRCRPASSLDLFTDSVRLMGDATLASAMEFDRTLDPQRLSDALDVCIGAFPILSSRLVRDGGPAHWEFVEAEAEVELVEAYADPRPLFVNPVDPHEVPQVKVRQLRTASGDTIVVSLAHAAADGHGLMALSRALLEAYRDPRSVPLATDGLPERDTLWTEGLLDSDEEVGGLEVINPMWPSPCPPSRAPSTFHRAIVPWEGVDRIRALARSHGGTVNDALMAAYFLAMSDLTGHNGPQSVFFPVDLRRYLPAGSRTMTNQAVNVGFSLTREHGEGMNGLLDKVVSETSRMKSRKLGIGEQVAFDRGCDPTGASMQRMVEEMAALQDKGLADIFISNPGRFDLPALPGLKDAYVLYPGGYMPTTCFVASTFGGNMTVTMGYQDDEASREATRRAMEMFLGHLPVGRPELF